MQQHAAYGHLDTRQRTSRSVPAVGGGWSAGDGREDDPGKASSLLGFGVLGPLLGEHGESIQPRCTFCWRQVPGLFQPLKKVMPESP